MTDKIEKAGVPGGGIPTGEKPLVARYVMVEPNGFRIGPSHGSSDRHIQDIHAPGLANGWHSVLFFRTRHFDGMPTFTVRFASSQQHLINHTFADTVPVPWHKTIPPGMLLTQNNELIFNVSGDGMIDFGDIFILYMSNELTIKVPIVSDP